MRHTSLLLSLVFCVAMVSAGRAQSTQYADNCITNVDNATAIIPSTVDPSLPNGSSLAPDDTIAVQNSEGDCVGYGAWTDDGHDLAIAVAGPTGIPEAPSGLSPTDSLSWTVFDNSRGRVVDLGSQVAYAACDTISVPTCQNDGTYADGAVVILQAFDHPVYTLAVTGDDGTDNNAGWRMLSVPAAEATRASLEDDLDFSVMPWSVVRRWEDGQWTAQQSSDTLSRGTGFIFYFYDSETNPVDADGLPLDVARGPENTTVDEKVRGLDQSEEWVLLGNPFPVSFDLGALANGDLASAGFQATAHVWDPDAGQYRLITQGTTGDNIAAWQGFFVQRSTIGEGQTSLTFGPEGQNSDSTGFLIGSKSRQTTPPFKKTAISTNDPSGATQSAEVRLRLELTTNSGDPVPPDRATYRVDPRATPRYDAYDAEELPPMSSDGYASVTLPILDSGEVLHRALGAAPPPIENTSFHRSIPLSVRGVETNGTATLSWPEGQDRGVPEDWTVRLNDTQSDSTINLRRRDYTFDLEQGTTLARPQDARFRLELQRNASPMSLAHMEGTASGEQVTLRWKTSSERKNAGFRIERRGETREAQWTQVGYVKGAGTNDNPQHYRFTDADLPYTADTLQYRLQAMTKEGSAAASDPISVSRGSIDALQLLGTYPNPASTQATVRYAIPNDQQTDEAVELALYDVLGRHVRTLPTSGKAGRHERQLSVSDLASGVYFLRLHAGDSVKTRKLTVVQ